jgi:hypothetical protein
MVRKQCADYDNLCQLVDDGKDKNAELDQVGNHYFLSWKNASGNGLPTGKHQKNLKHRHSGWTTSVNDMNCL